MNNLIIIQARTNSKRFKNKVLCDVGNKLLIDYAIDAAKDTNLDFVVAIPKNDLKLIEYLSHRKIDYFEGPEEDVLSRFYQCAKKYRPKTIIRLCADTVYLPGEINEIRALYNLRKRFTYGNGVWIFSALELDKAHEHARGNNREHVCTWLYRSIDFRGDIDKLSLL